MHIEKAKNLRPGDFVVCPADGGSPEYTGMITSVNPVEQQDLFGKKFLRVKVKQLNGPNMTSWPTSRLVIERLI